MATFKESNFRFTDPIRYFKANDPIYFEVDNIPLKQLQENNLWLKDQFEKLEYQQIFNTSNITNNTLAPGRSGFSELQPYVTNSDNKVYVRPGRYTARINDVFNLQPLQIIQKLADDNYANVLNFKTNRDGAIRTILNTFKTQLQSNALGMNGLMERAFTKASKTNDTLTSFLANINTTYPGYKSPLPTGMAELPYPGTVGQTYIYNLAVSNVTSPTIDSTEGGLALPWHESNWIKKWRGVARTSIVDVQQELNIQIPAFSQDDFYYIDENGVRKTLTSATQRIDLLFIYSKPIDASAATIAKFVDGATGPAKIYAPQLGIVKGAGVGLNLDTRNYNSNTPQNAALLQDLNGNSMIAPSISDELGENLGFSGIKGSFPSPDDLLNLAPTLVDNLESNNINLLGQSILPIAYIVVKKNAAVNANNAPILTSADIIDIRPFFRTAELTFNERSGLAAAHPQVSLANPVATEFYVDSVAKELASRIAGISPTAGTSQTTTLPQNMPRIVYSGKILGGWTWGPEKVLFNYIKYSNPSISDEEAYNVMRDKFFYGNIPIQDVYPTWDYSHWAVNLLDPNTLQSVDAIGKKIGDYINYLKYTPSGNTAIPYFLGPSFGIVGGTESRAINAPVAGDTHWVSKEFVMNGDSIPWSTDLDIRVTYLNCSPSKLSEKGGLFTTRRKLANGTIALGVHVAWEYTGTTTPFFNRNLTTDYNNFTVLNPEITRLVEVSDANSRGNSNYGTCYLPSVTFDIIAYPSDWKQNKFFTTRNPASTIIELK